MKKYFFIVFLCTCFFPAAARHVAGGELFYEYLGPGDAPGMSTYRITLRLFRDCASNGPLLENEPVTAGIFNAADNTLISTLPLKRIDGIRTIQLNTASFPCLVGNPKVCYEIGIYSAIATLADNAAGYILSRTGCCRIDKIDNLAVKSSVGSNYVTRIPGTSTLPIGHNNSPQFNVRDTALVCALKNFKLDFGAQDPDGDSLSYSFCEAYTSASSGVDQQPSFLLNLVPLPYTFPYSGASPLGAGVKINPATGIISGVAPPQGINTAGQYVVNVCITEWRNGKPITQHRKDFILKVQDCDIIESDLPDQIVQCKDSTVHFENQSTSSAIISYLWKFGDRDSSSSTKAILDFTYPDTGRYVARLTVNGPRGCVGSDSTVVLVFPGFTPAFDIIGSCYLNPYLFKDATVTKYGFVNSWRWDFGDVTTDTDFSTSRNATYKYTGISKNEVSLVVTSSKGCIDSLHKTLEVSDKPILKLPFRDTLICNIDSLPINVTNVPGVFSWVPNKNILFPNTPSPVVFPKDTTKYIVTVNDQGCISTDTVTVNVLPFITVDAGNDSVICKSDIIQLHPVSHALQYQWKASSGETVSNTKYPFVQPAATTKYYVTANLGHCQDKDSVTIKTVNYPTVILGPDTVICPGSRIILRSTIIGSSFTWSPLTSLLNANTTTPVAGPSKTTEYVLRVVDTIGCPKPSFDTILVTVAPTVVANAGRDTITIPDQPLQLEASGGQRYIWSPMMGLNNPAIFNPVAILNSDIDSIRYKVRVFDSNGCFGDDEIVIRVFKTAPDIFVPTAFTPNGDGKNDVIRPLPVAISKLTYFNIYNRWGQLMFSSSELGKGWDGTYNGIKQPSGTYVFSAEAVDYQGKTIVRKGTVVLIR